MKQKNPSKSKRFQVGLRNAKRSKIDLIQSWYPTNSRHLNLNQLMAEAFSGQTFEEEAASSKTEC